MDDFPFSQMGPFYLGLGTIGSEDDDENEGRSDQLFVTEHLSRALEHDILRSNTIICSHRLRGSVPPKYGIHRKDVCHP